MCVTFQTMPFKDVPTEQVAKKTIQFPINYYASGVACTPDEKIAICGYSWPDKTRIYRMDGQEITTIQSPTFMKKMFSFGTSSEVWDVACSRYNLYLTDNSSGQVFMFSFDGAHINTIPVGYKGKAGIALTDDYIYVTSQHENVVYRLHMPAGEKKKVFIQDDEGISQPTFVAANARYVAVSSNGNHRVFMYNADGRRQFEYGRHGVEAGKLNHPWGVLIDAADRLIISDASNNRICFVSSEGQHIMDIDLTKYNLEFPRGLAFTHAGQMVVACKTDVAVFEYGFN